MLNMIFFLKFIEKPKTFFCVLQPKNDKDLPVATVLLPMDVNICQSVTCDSSFLYMCLSISQPLIRKDFIKLNILMAQLIDKGTFSNIILSCIRVKLTNFSQLRFLCKIKTKNITWYLRIFQRKIFAVKLIFYLVIQWNIQRNRTVTQMSEDVREGRENRVKMEKIFVKIRSFFFWHIVKFCVRTLHWNEVAERFFLWQFSTHDW